MFHYPSLTTVTNHTTDTIQQTWYPHRELELLDKDVDENRLQDWASILSMLLDDNAGKTQWINDGNTPFPDEVVTGIPKEHIHGLRSNNNGKIYASVYHPIEGGDGTMKRKPHWLVVIE